MTPAPAASTFGSSRATGGSLVYGGAHRQLTKRFGARPRLIWYDTHVTVDNLKGETRVNGKALAGVA